MQLLTLPKLCGRAAKDKTRVKGNRENGEDTENATHTIDEAVDTPPGTEEGIVDTLVAKNTPIPGDAPMVNETIATPATEQSTSLPRYALHSKRSLPAHLMSTTSRSSFPEGGNDVTQILQCTTVNYQVMYNAHACHDVMYV